MRLNVKHVMLMVMVLAITACKIPLNSPEEYFDRAALNTNTLSRFGGEYFNTYQKYIKQTNGVGDFNTCEKYLKNYSIAFARRDLKKVKSLAITEETKPMIDASIDLYNFVLESYQTDHIQIARMIDRQAPAEEINTAINKLNTKSYDSFALKYDKLWKIAEQYAKDNDITVKTMPF